MPQKIGVIADTNACLDYFDYDYDIKIFRSMIHLGEEEYLDHVELSADAFYERLKADKSLFPRTSQFPTAKMEAMYRTMQKEGYTDLIVITISQHMSGTYSAAQVAARDIEGLNVHVVDSRTVAFPEAHMALTAAKMADEGKAVDDILQAIDHIRNNNHILFAVDTLEYLVKNGRLTNAQGFMGRMLKIKPLLHISKAGKVENIEKIRTFKKAVDRVIEHYLEETEGLDVEPFICHAHNTSMRDYIEAEIKAKRANVEAIFSIPITPAVGAHAGPGAIGLGYIIKENRAK